MRRAISAMLGTLLLLGLGMALGSRAFAQAPTTGTLRVTVVDPSGAVIVGSTVVVTNVEQSTNGAAIEPVKTSDTGVATISGLPPGRYTIQAEFPAFETKLLKDVRVRSGENKQLVVLPLQKMEASVTVGQDRREAASDRVRR